MLAVASNLFGKSSSLNAYTLHSAGSSSSPSASSTNLPATAGSSSSVGQNATQSKAFNVGLWKVLGATHKTTGKDVSVWVFEKKLLDGIKGDSSGRGAQHSKEWVVEQLKKEATSLTRLRHPDLLHMVEPLEDARTEMTFVTEMVTSSLGNLLSKSAGSSSGASRRRDGQSRPPPAETSNEVDLDEVEIQKGTLQIARALTFLHQQAKLVHLNLSPDAILINAKGDWKLSGLSNTTPLSQPDGSATKYVYPEFDARLPPQVQWKLDYLAPEYALDSTLTPSSDLYSLGCVLFAVHMNGKPPFQNRGSMSTLRDNAEGSLVRRDWASGSKWERCSSELKDLLPRLLTRQPSTRISLASLPSHSFFSSLAINTLNFLDPTAFAAKPREEKATFLRGLIRVLPTFSDRLRRGKILPSLLEEMKDPYLLPFLLPNVFEISRTLTAEEFSPVLLKLRPLFALKDPPQNMLTLLEHLSLFEEKTSPAQFREHVMPLIYNSLECEHLPVQEKVLKTVPHLCEILDYGTVQNVLLVKVAILFSSTRILSVKVQTLECFTSMVKTLDKATLTTKLVPMLAKIKTKEPAVMMATLAVHEAMGAKVDREAIATLVLPQLWAMSMGPLLNADQFGHFMVVIRSLGTRVEQEHTQHLRDVRRIEQQTERFNPQSANGSDFNMNGSTGEIDFESLVKGDSPAPADMSAVPSADPWDEGWLDATNDSVSTSSFQSALNLNGHALPQLQHQPSLSTMRTNSSASASRLKARPIPASTFNSSAFASSSASSFPSPSALQPSQAQPSQSLSSFAALQPSSRMSGPASQATSSTSSGPNYNLSLAPQIVSQAPLQPLSPRPPVSATTSYPYNTTPAFAPPPLSTFNPPAPTPIQSTPSVRPPPGWQSGVMQPSIKAKPAWPQGGGGASDWGDFDPLK